MTSYAQPYADPTNVVGARIGAWLIDLVIYLALAVGVMAATGGLKIETYQARSPGAAESYCTGWRDTHKGFCGTSGTGTDAEAITVEGGAGGSVFFLLHFVAYVVIQGLTGGSLGKLAVGLRVVDAQGRRAGIGKSLLRTIMWIGDAITCGLPIVGGVMLLSTKGHRRLGDMAAGTYVVRKAAMGQPIEASGAAAYGGAPGAPAGAWGGNYPAGGTGGGWPTPPTGPGSTWSPPSGSTPTGPAAAPVAAGGDGPTWDAARNTYIQFDRERGAWLQWDDHLKVWGPIDQ